MAKEARAETRSIRCLIVNAEPTGWRLWRSKQMIREYGQSSNLLALFFVTRHPRRREIVYEYGGAKIVDRGPLITAEKGSYTEIDAMLELARIKGWKRIKLRGTQEFKAEAMRQAILRGFDVAADPLDQVLLRKVRADIDFDRSSPESTVPFVAPVPKPK